MPVSRPNTLTALPMKTSLLFVLATLLITAGAVALAVMDAVWLGLGLIGLGLALELGALPSLLAWLRARRTAD